MTWFQEKHKQPPLDTSSSCWNADCRAGRLITAVISKHVWSSVKFNKRQYFDTCRHRHYFPFSVKFQTNKRMIKLIIFLHRKTIDIWAIKELAEYYVGTYLLYRYPVNFFNIILFPIEHEPCIVIKLKIYWNNS